MKCKRVYKFSQCSLLQTSFLRQIKYLLLLKMIIVLKFCIYIFFAKVLLNICMILTKTINLNVHLPNIIGWEGECNIKPSVVFIKTKMWLLKNYCAYRPSIKRYLPPPVTHSHHRSKTCLFLFAVSLHSLFGCLSRYKFSSTLLYQAGFLNIINIKNNNSHCVVESK